MPIYVYRCSECGTEFEKRVRIAESDWEQVCPSCRGRHALKLTSSSASLETSVRTSAPSAGTCSDDGST